MKTTEHQWQNQSPSNLTCLQHYKLCLISYMNGIELYTHSNSLVRHNSIQSENTINSPNTVDTISMSIVNCMYQSSTERIKH
jgi:hypothetical protein